MVYIYILFKARDMRTAYGQVMSVRLTVYTMMDGIFSVFMFRPGSGSEAVTDMVIGCHTTGFQ